MNYVQSLPEHIVQDILVHIRPAVVSPFASLDLRAMAARRRADHLAWPQFFGALTSFDRSFFTRHGPPAMRRAYERIFLRRVTIDAAPALIAVDASMGDESWRRAIAWLRYMILLARTSLRFRVFVGVEVSAMARPIDVMLMFCAIVSAPGRQVGVNRLVFLAQFFRWQGQAVICFVARHLFLSGHAAVAECVARLVLDEDWHRRALFSFARSIFTTDTERARQLLLQCLDLPTPHDAAPPPFDAVTAATLEPISPDFGKQFVERCKQAILVPTVSVGRQDEETLDNFVNERQWLIDLCDAESATIKSGNDTYLSGISAANVPRLVQRDWQTLGSIGFALAVMRDAHNSQHAFDMARELQAASPYPAERPTQGRLSKSELSAAAVLGDRALFDERFSYWRQRVANDLHALRALLSDVIAASRIDLAESLIGEFAAQMQAPELGAVVAAAITAAGRAASAASASEFFSAVRPFLAALVAQHKAELSHDATARPSQLNLWLELSRAAVAIAAPDELTIATSVLRSHFGKPMVRSLIDVCAATVEAQTTRALTPVDRLQVKVTALQLVSEIGALFAGRALPTSLQIEVLKLCGVLLDLNCHDAALELIAAHEATLDCSALADSDEPLQQQLLFDLALVLVRLKRFARAAPLIVHLHTNLRVRQSELIVALGRQGHFEVSLALLRRVPVTSSWRAERLQQLSIDCAVSLRTKRSWANTFTWFESLIEQPGWTTSERFSAYGGFMSGILVDAQLDLYEDVDHFYSTGSEHGPDLTDADAATVSAVTVAEIEQALESQR